MTKRNYVSSVRASAAAETHERIIAAGAKLLRKDASIANFSLDVVAKVAGVTRLTVYNQFGSRRGLLEAVFDDVAFRGGLHRLPEAMAEQDPRVALRKVVAIFCDFWYFNRRMLGQIIGAGVADLRLENAIRERNERRRKLLAAIVRRLAGAGGAPPEVDEVVDVLS